MHIVRYMVRDDGYENVGVLDGDRVIELGETSIARLLRLPLAELRNLCEQAKGREYHKSAIRLLPPVDRFTEVWAAGVTYRKSQQERMLESHQSASVYDLVYDAERPELFLKAVAWRVVGDGEPIAIRSDSEIDVPEPELALIINTFGEVVGYSVCDDVSSRSIEAENPLYLPQAKIYLGSCALGFGIRPVWEVPDPLALDIRLCIIRNSCVAWEGQANTRQLHRNFDDLIGFLMRDNGFPDGVVLSTGTGIVPPLPFSLEPGDIVEIEIEAVGTLTNPVVRGREGVEWIVGAMKDGRNSDE